MAKCDEGYNCVVCGLPVEAITESGLYLRYILGDILLERMHTFPEQHIRCVPELAQYIVAEGFDPVACEGPFAKHELDGQYVAAQEERVTAAWQRLQALPTLGVSLLEYPLPKPSISQ
jgi:hypothetical protein